MSREMRGLKILFYFKAKLSKRNRIEPLETRLMPGASDKALHPKHHEALIPSIQKLPSPDDSSRPFCRVPPPVAPDAGARWHSGGRLLSISGIGVARLNHLLPDPGKYRRQHHPHMADDAPCAGMVRLRSRLADADRGCSTRHSLRLRRWGGICF